MKRSEQLNQKMQQLRSELVAAIENILNGISDNTYIFDTCPKIIPHAVGNHLHAEKVYMGGGKVLIEDNDGSIYKASDNGFNGLPVSTLVEILNGMEENQ
jgi:hypothetical protein